MGKNDDRSTYEVWSMKDDGQWVRIVDGKNDGVFEHDKRALAVAGAKAAGPGVVEVLVIERRVVAAFNGEAISLKGQLSSGGGAAGRVGRKKEEEKSDGSAAAVPGDVHGDRASEDTVGHAGH